MAYSLQTHTVRSLIKMPLKYRTLSLHLTFPRNSGNYSKVGIVDNGDCKDPSSFRIKGNKNATGHAVVNGGYTSDGPNVANTANQVSCSPENNVMRV